MTELLRTDSIENIVMSYHTNKEDTIKIIKKIMNRYLVTTNIETITLNNFIKFIPLPAYFITSHLDNIIINNNIYKLSKKENFVILPANITIPSPLYSPIPFTLLYNNTLLSSNVYYYEITIISGNNSNTSIGFGTTETNIDMNNIIGWTNDSIGYNSMDGSICCWGEKDKIFEEFTQGDTVGAGVIYKEKDVYIFFFTLNGIQCPETFTIKTKKRLVPMIGLKYPITIEINLNTNPFKYDYRCHIMPIVISSNNNFIKEYYNSNMYDYMIKYLIRDENNKLKYE